MNGTDVGALGLQDKEEREYQRYYMETWLTISSVQYWLVLGVCIASSGMLVATGVLLQKHRRSPYYAFLTCMVVSELVMLGTILSDLATQRLIPLNKGPALCKTIQFMSGVAACFANWTWVVMFVQRFSYVAWPLGPPKRLRFLQSSRTLLTCTLLFALVTQCWAFAIFTERRLTDPTNGKIAIVCGQDEERFSSLVFKLVAVTEAVTTYAVPFLGTIFADLAVVMYLRRTTRLTVMTFTRVDAAPSSASENAALISRRAKREKGHVEREKSSLLAVNGAGDLSARQANSGSGGDSDAFKIQSFKSLQTCMERRRRATRRCLLMATIQVLLNCPHYTFQIVDEIWSLRTRTTFYLYADAILYLLYLSQFPMLLFYVHILHHPDRWHASRRNRQQPPTVSGATTLANLCAHNSHNHGNQPNNNNQTIDNGSTGDHDQDQTAAAATATHDQAQE